MSLVTVNWQDETNIDGVNTCWDTHQNNFAKLKDLLCPLFDQAFPAFVEDLHQRGLLETTLVVAVGEFGRTPKLGQFTQSSNTQKTGRDHWPHAFTALLAGGGVRGGQVYGATTRDGGYVRGQAGDAGRPDGDDPAPPGHRPHAASTRTSSSTCGTGSATANPSATWAEEHGRRRDRRDLRPPCPGPHRADLNTFVVGVHEATNGWELYHQRNAVLYTTMRTVTLSAGMYHTKTCSRGPRGNPTRNTSSSPWSTGR